MSREAAVIGAPGQLKRLGTDAFTASAACRIRSRDWSCGEWLAAKSSEGVRSRQKFLVAEADCFALLVTLTVAGDVGVQSVEQRPDLRSWKVKTREILFCTL